MWPWLQFFLLLLVALCCHSVPLNSTDIERREHLEKNLNLNSWWDCLQNSVEKTSEESDGSLSEDGLLEDNYLQHVRGTRKINRTLFKDDSVKPAGRRDKKKKKKYQLLATAAIAAKAASVATALTILLPLALKILAVLAIKSVFVGTVAILMTSFFGLFKMIQESPEQKTVIYVHKNPKHSF